MEASPTCTQRFLQNARRSAYPRRRSGCRDHSQPTLPSHTPSHHTCWRTLRDHPPNPCSYGPFNWDPLTNPRSCEPPSWLSPPTTRITQATAPPPARSRTNPHSNTGNADSPSTTELRTASPNENTAGNEVQASANISSSRKTRRSATLGKIKIPPVLYPSKLQVPDRI